MTTPAPIPYIPQPIQSVAELSALLSAPLSDIRRTSNIKPYLDLLNEIAFHQQRWAEDVVRLALAAIAEERVADSRLSLFYLCDTLCKNRRIQTQYRRLLAPLIAVPFVSSYKHAGEVTRRAMDKLLSAWRSNQLFDVALLDHIDVRLKELEEGTGGKRTADVLGDSDVVHKPLALTPHVQDTLHVLEVSLAQHPHLLPLLYEIKAMLNTPGMEIAHVAPKIAALTTALTTAVAQQQQQQAQQQQRQTPSPQPVPTQQPPPAGYGHYNQAAYPPQYQQPPQHQPHYPQPATATAGHSYHQRYRQPPSGPSSYAPYPPGAAPYLQPLTASYPRTSPERDMKYQLQAGKPKTFDTEDLKTRDEYVIASLYDLIPHRCQTCGFRCPTSDAMSAHLDYHFRLSSRQRKRDSLHSQQQLHQSLYWTEQDWLDSDDVVFQRSQLALDDRANDDANDDVADGGDGGGKHSVQVDESQMTCAVCGESLETYWDDEDESWMYRNAIRVAKDDVDDTAAGSGSGGGGGGRDERGRERKRRVHVEFDGKIVHWACYRSLLSTQEVSVVKSEEQKAKEEDMPALEPVKAEVETG